MNNRCANNIYILFPDGTGCMVDTSYHNPEIKIGEKIIIEGGSAYIVTDVQHQIRKPPAGPKMIITNIILEDWKPKS